MQSTKIGNVEIKSSYSSEWNEYRINVYENGKMNCDKTYFTDDREDCLDTFEMVVKQERENQSKEKGNLNLRILNEEQEIILEDIERKENEISSLKKDLQRNKIRIANYDCAMVENQTKK